MEMFDYNMLLDDLGSKQYQRLQAELLQQNPADIAGFLETLESEKAVVIFRMLTKDTASEVFADLFPETQRSIIEALTDKEIAVIIDELYLDDAADFIEEMPAGIVKKVLANAREDTRAQINSLLQYPDNSAGSIMTVEFVDMPGDITIAEAFGRIRRVGPDKETIYTCYVTDGTRHLEGVVSVRKLLLSDSGARVRDVMDTVFVAARTLDDQEAVAHQFKKYDLLCLPVVDKEDRLVGIITIDDIIDVVQEEATEDFEKMAAMRPSEKPYLRTGILSLARNRITWLLVLMISGMITGGIMKQYTAAIAAVPLLVTFVPMITGTGGNAGSQSSTVVIRGMALNEIGARDFARIWWKELRTSLVVGVLLSAVNFVRVYFQEGDVVLGLTVSASMLLTVVIAQTLGGLLPMAARACRADPAVMAAPLISTMVDAVSLIIFFTIAQFILPL
ncbi:MAG: magnesium transporter [Oscillospiraceae bacterium]|jgi:magnesium transporter|nr:magnesium transporter [Oscillospiraceae bacterium]